MVLGHILLCLRHHKMKMNYQMMDESKNQYPSHFQHDFQLNHYIKRHQYNQDLIHQAV